MWAEDQARPFSVMPSERTGRNGHKVKYRKSRLNIFKVFLFLFFFFFYFKGDQTQEQVAERGGVVSILGHNSLDTILDNLL